MYKKTIIFLLPVLLVWGALEFFYRTTETNYTYKHKQIITKYADSEILLFGNSHALYGLDPAFFERKTFNISNVSQSLYFDELLFNKHAKNLPNLKAIVLTVSYFSLSQEDNTSEDLWRKYFYRQQMELEVPVISDFDVKKYSVSLARRFNKSVELFQEYIEKGTNVNCFENGYGMQDASDIVDDKEEITPIIVKKHEDGLKDFTTNTKRLERIIEACKQNRITVFLVEMPVYKTYYDSLNSEKKEKITSTLEALEKKYGNAHFLKLSQDARFEAADLRDADHLTNKGAEKCSRILNDYIEERLERN